MRPENVISRLKRDILKTIDPGRPGPFSRETDGIPLSSLDSAAVTLYGYDSDGNLYIQANITQVDSHSYVVHPGSFWS